jgi:hypothetical protein
MMREKTEPRMRSRVFTVAALALSVALAGCESFDPLDKLSELDIMGVSKTPLKGDRRPVFDSGVPGVPQGVPPEMVRGYQAPPETPPPVVEAKPEKKPKPKKTASAPPRRAPPPPAQEQQQMRQAPAAQSRTTTQQVDQSAGQMQQMPGSQPAWPSNAPPAPAAWPGPQR